MLTARVNARKMIGSSMRIPFGYLGLNSSMDRGVIVRPSEVSMSILLPANARKRND